MQPVRILAEDGSLLGDSPLTTDEIRDRFADLVEARTYDRKCSALQRQGRLATYAQYEGQEACQVGSAAVLRDDDWMVATYRDAAAMWMHGYTWRNLLLGRMGDERGGAAPEGVHVLPPSITVGAHMIHAVGLAWGERLQDRDRIAITYFGDGATSEGDFHEAMNFAGVYGTGTVFFCQNNHFAISMPRDRQTASETIAQKADAYGMPGVLVDGNDLLAVTAVTRDAVDRARRGDGPTLIEALTYRIGPHTTTDDAGRYRHDDHVEEWRQRDPIDRVRHHLRSVDAWDQSWEDQLAEAASERIESAVAEAEALEAFDPGSIFDAIFADPPAQLTDQRRALLAEMGELDA